MPVQEVVVCHAPRIGSGALALCVALAAGCSSAPNDESFGVSSNAVGVSDRQDDPRHGGHKRHGHGGHSDGGACGRGGAGGVTGGGAGGQASSGETNGGRGGDTGGGGASAGQAGSGETNGGNAGSGGTAATAVASPTSFDFIGQCNVGAQDLTISNTGGSTFTWVANVLGAVPIHIIPSSSTLLPGASVTVEVSPFFPPIVTGSQNVSGTIAITTDVAGALPPIAVVYGVSGFTVVPPADIDFGAVSVGSTKSISFSASQVSLPGVLLVSSNFDFLLTGAAPADPSPGFWTLKFTPRVIGSQSTTLTIGSFSGVVCAPNTFAATGVGVAP